MARTGLYLSILFLLLALVACAPKPAPVALTPAPQPTTSVPGPSTAPSLSQEDLAWATVIEAAKKERQLV